MPGGHITGAVLLFIVFLVGPGCRQTERPTTILPVANLRPRIVPAARLFADVEIVRSKAFVGEVSDLLGWQGKYVILDKLLKAVHLLDEKGRRTGLIQGDVESNGYSLNPQAICISHQNHLLVYDRNGFLYTFKDTVLVKKEKFAFFLDKIAKTGTGYVAFKNQQANNFEDSTYFYDLIFLDTAMRVINKRYRFNIALNQSRYWAFLEHPLTVTKNEVFFSRVFNDTIYRYSFTGKLLGALTINFETGKSPGQFPEVNLSEPVEVLEEIVKKYCFNVGYFLDTRYHRSFLFNNKFSTCLFWQSKKNSRALAIKHLTGNFEGEKTVLPFPFYENDRYVYGVIDERHLNFMLHDIDDYAPFKEGLLNGGVFIVKYSLKSKQL